MIDYNYLALDARLPALSGLARALAKSFPDLEYLAGLWRADLYRRLFWIWKMTQNYGDYIKQRQCECIAPSWSWVSRPGRISWFLGGQYPEFELRAANVVTDKLNRYGRVFSAYLELSAKNVQIGAARRGGREQQLEETPCKTAHEKREAGSGLYLLFTTSCVPNMTAT
jgi:hypothetical protein